MNGISNGLNNDISCIVYEQNMLADITTHGLQKLGIKNIIIIFEC